MRPNLHGGAIPESDKNPSQYQESIAVSRIYRSIKNGQCRLSKLRACKQSPLVLSLSD